MGMGVPSASCDLSVPWLTLYPPLPLTAGRLGLRYLYNNTPLAENEILPTHTPTFTGSVFHSIENLWTLLRKQILVQSLTRKHLGSYCPILIHRRHLCPLIFKSQRDFKRTKTVNLEEVTGFSLMNQRHQIKYSLPNIFSGVICPHAQRNSFVHRCSSVKNTVLCIPTTQLNLCGCVCACVCVYMYNICICLYVCLYMCVLRVYTCVYKCVCICVDMYACIVYRRVFTCMLGGVLH